MKLYELSKIYKNIENLIDNEEIDSEDLKIALDNVNEEFDDKADNIVKLIKQEKSDTEALYEEIKRLQAKKKALENRTKFLKEYLTANMKLVNKNKIKTPFYSVSFMRTEAVKILDIDKLDKEFKIIKEEPNKIDIKKAIKSGLVVNGAELEERESLIIK